jgi:hypothetical protein
LPFDFLTRHPTTASKSQQHAWAVKFVEAGKSRPSMRDVARRVTTGGHAEYGGGGGGGRSSGGGGGGGGCRGTMMGAESCGGGDGTQSVAASSSASSFLPHAGDAGTDSGGSRIGGASSSSGLLLLGTGVGSVTFEVCARDTDCFLRDPLTWPIQAYCDVVRFPISMSRLLRLRCYLVAAQGHLFDYTAHTHKIVPPDVARSLAANSITFPDVGCLCSAIETLTMNMAPFPEIDLFRQRCFTSFAINQRRGLTLTQILHLYVAAYQKRDLWKHCWKRIYPIMSAQIARDVEVIPFFGSLLSKTVALTGWVVPGLRCDGPLRCHALHLHRQDEHAVCGLILEHHSRPLGGQGAGAAPSLLLLSLSAAFLLRFDDDDDDDDDWTSTTLILACFRA